MAIPFYCLSGLPRSGSTVFSDMLCQNPEIEISSTSALCNTLNAIRGVYTVESQALAENRDIVIKKASKATSAFIQAYKCDPDKIYIDKSRGWPAFYEFLSTLGFEPKMIFTIRDLRGIYASFESLYRKGGFELTRFKDKYSDRVHTMADRQRLNSELPLEHNLRVLSDFISRGLKDKALWIRYEDFTQDPIREIDRFYSFTGIKKCHHYTSGIRHVVQEDDRQYGQPGLHDIDPAIRKSKEDYEEILGKELSDSIRDRQLWFYKMFYEEKLNG